MNINNVISRLMVFFDINYYENDDNINDIPIEVFNIDGPYAKLS